jgi:aminoglycoside phosphotransferase family enzyme
MELPALIEALRRPEAYPHAPTGPVEVVQTHISVLFFAGDRVFKVKKPVRLDFLDYSTLESRRRFCDEEVRLNRRLAPNTYVGVVPIALDGSGGVRVGGKGAPIEYAVEMVRLPAERMMDAFLERGAIDNEQMNAIVEVLARFHEGCPTGAGVDEHGGPDEIGRQIEENVEELRAFVGGSLGASIHRRLADRARAWLAENREQLKRRVGDGRIREGHGDVHAGNICLLPDGIVIYDCIEFTPRFRCRDVACELGFLAMDLDFRCFRGFAQYLLRRYAAVTGDPDLPDVAAFYKMHLAAIRGKVASIKSADAAVDDAERRAARQEAMRYFHLAASYTLPPALIVTCGLPGTGKSHVARAAARPFEAVILRSDVVRKQLAGIAPAERGGAGDLDEGIYTPAFTERTYDTVLEQARGHLAHGRSVVLDATFSTRRLRDAAFAAAAAAGAPALLIEVVTPAETVEAWLRERAHDPTEVSDADLAVHQHARERFEPTDERAAGERVEVDGRMDAETMAGVVVDGLIALAD